MEDKQTNSDGVLVGVVSLGCDKNRVDTENMMTYLANEGYNFTSDSSQADIIIVNTCAFIKSSRNESFDTVEEMINYRKKGKCSCLILTGCYPQRYINELQTDFPEVDIFLGVNEYKDICKIIKRFYADKKRKKIIEIDSPYKIDAIEKGRVITTPSYYAYVKIADGCDNFCSYCTIPYIRGRYRSRKIESIVAETADLVKNGAKEIILVAQDVANYGIDLYKEKKLTELVQKLSKIDNLEWIRLLYCYPENIEDSLIKELHENKKLCAYIDVPFQHVNNEILRLMNRKITKNKIVDLLDKIRSGDRHIAVRSTFIVGFPGETKQNFNELLEFLLKYKMPNVGFFAYSREDGTVAARFDNQVDEITKKQRLMKAMKVQRKIIAEYNNRFLNKTIKVLVEGQDLNKGLYYGRTEYQAPDIDTLTYFESDEPIELGQFYMVKINKIKGYDLFGTKISTKE